jgi:hypothetical protein
MVVTTILFAHTTFLWATCCLICFIPIVSRSWHTDLDYGSYRLSNVEIGLTADVTGQQGMLTPPWHLIPPLNIQRSVYAHSLICISYKTNEIDYWSSFHRNGLFLLGCWCTIRDACRMCRQDKIILSCTVLELWTRTYTWMQVKPGESVIRCKFWCTRYVFRLIKSLQWRSSRKDGNARTRMSKWHNFAFESFKQRNDNVL